MKKILFSSLFAMCMALLIGCSSEEVQSETPEGVVDIIEVEDGQIITYESGLKVKLSDGKYYLSDDVLLSEQQIEKINQANELRSAGLIQTYYRWPNRTIPYKFREGDFNAAAEAQIRAYLEPFNTQTCVWVREATAADKDYVLITNENNGAWSYLGRQGGEQQLNIQHSSVGSTLDSKSILRVMLTAAGVIREFRRPDRDNYLLILWDNIAPSQEFNFYPYTWLQVSDFGVEFDIESVTMPGAYLGSKNGQRTILSIQDPNFIVGQSKQFTRSDILGLNRMYGCE